MDNRDEELFNGIIDVPKQTVNNQSNNTNLEYNFNFETEVKPVPQNDYSNFNQQQNPSINQSLNTPAPEVLSFKDSNNIEAIDTVEETKKIDHELLKNLNNDTNNFVNPDLIVNPSVKDLTESVKKLEVEEPKVDYKEIRTKKNYAFMLIIFAIIIIFIIFLPKIVAIIGL